MALLRDRHDVVDEHERADGTVADPRPPDAGIDHGRERVVVRRNSVGQTLRAVVATVCLLAIAAFMVLNTDDVSVDLGFETYDAPLWLAVGSAAAAGVVLGWMLGWRRCRRPHTT